LAGLPLSSAIAKLNSVVDGVHLGVQTYSFREFKGDDVMGQIIKAMTDIGLSECEFFGPPLDRAAGGKEHMSDAERLAIPLDNYKKIGQRFADAGIQVYGYNGSFGASEAQNNRTFEIAKAMGAKIVTWSGTISVARQIAPLVDDHKVIVACHGHSNTKDPNQFATPESFATVMSLSKYFWVNLDIGHFSAAGYDPVEYSTTIALPIST
jgi:sugar phosphate isomerase/epimerase